MKTKYNVDPDVVIFRPEENKRIERFAVGGTIAVSILPFLITVAHWIMPEKLIFFDPETIFFYISKLEKDYDLLVSYGRKAFADGFINYYFNTVFMSLIFTLLLLLVLVVLTIAYGHPIPKLAMKSVLYGLMAIIAIGIAVFVIDTPFREPGEISTAKLSLNSISYIKVCVFVTAFCFAVYGLLMGLIKHAMFWLYDWRKLRS